MQESADHVGIRRLEKRRNSEGKVEGSHCQPMTERVTHYLASIIDWLPSNERKAGWLNGADG